MARIRVVPEDFQVEELPLYEPSGSGSFLWLWIEKRLLNTQDVALELARQLDVHRREVGFAGRKDRRALTRQAFTLPAELEGRLGELDIEGVRILQVEKTDHRLRTGQLLGNRFSLVVREVAADSMPEIAERFDSLTEGGMANRFGAQRFGRDGRNVDKGRKILESGRFKGDRRRAFLMVSALQSAVFNEVLRRRSHNELMAGDLAWVHATDDWLWIDDPGAHQERLRAFEISPTGPIFGTKTKRPKGSVAELEAGVMADFELPPSTEIRPPKGMQIYGDRRPLRVLPQNGNLFRAADEDSIRVDFELPSGSYATVFLAELLGEDPLDGPDASESPDSTEGQ